MSHKHMTHAEAVAKAVKFLRLAQSDNVNEAALAAARAQEIIDRYKLVGIDAALDAGTPPEPDEPIQEFSRAPMEAEGSGIWRGRLAVEIARANQCKVYRSGAHGGAYIIVGRPSDAEAVRYLYAVLVREVDRITDREGKGCGKTWRNNFRLGMVDTIGDRLRAQFESTQQKLREEALGVGGGAIVKVDKAIARFKQKTAEVEAFYEGISKGFRKRYSRSVYDGEAREAGRKAGHEVSLGGAKGSLGAGRKALP